MEGQTVLVVEDDVRLSELVASVLTLAGYRPIAISDHALITGSVDRWRPQCVILDGEVRSSGESRTWDDASAIRRGHPTVPVVLFSGDSAALAEARAGRSRRSRAAAFAGFVGKPFVVEDFLATMKDAIERQPSPATHAWPAEAPGDTTAADATGPLADWPEATLFSTIVHELRQPLTVIRGQLQLGRRHIGEDPTRERGAMDTAIAQVDRMARLLTELTESSGLASETLSLNIGAVDLVRAIDAAIGMREDGDTTRISFHWVYGRVHVRGDPDRIAQILDNVLANALKYGAPGTPIEVTLTTLGHEAQVRVADHGPGVPEEERARLFTPFYRSASMRDLPGTGLGLHISHRLAERQGGRLWLDASSSAGSVFALALPVLTDGDGLNA